MIIRSFVLAASIAMLCGPDASAQEILVATYGEARTNLAFRIPETIVQKILPPGWLSSPFTSGPSKGANLTVTFMDWLTVQEPDGSPGKTYRSVGVSAPAKRNGTDVTVSMSIAGLSSPAGYAPGPYGNSVTAKSTVVRTLRTDDHDVSRAEEAWRFKAAIPCSWNSNSWAGPLRGVSYSPGCNPQLNRISTESTGSSRPLM
jgi:hypothetical protein